MHEPNFLDFDSSFEAGRGNGSRPMTEYVMYDYTVSGASGTHDGFTNDIMCPTLSRGWWRRWATLRPGRYLSTGETDKKDLML